MARLNDPPLPAPESIEALKRRFTRQNRDLARSNVAQSQRIRNLEVEVSNLLAQNVEWREATLKAEGEAKRWKRVSEELMGLGERVRRRWEEMEAVLGQMESVGRGGEGRRQSGVYQERKRRRSSKVEVERELLERPVLPEREGWLPTITEHKRFPRRTMEVAEVQELVNQPEHDAKDGESPDIGPPPVARFEGLDDPQQQIWSSDSEDRDVSALTKNLEIRRKRRTSSLVTDLTNGHVESSDSENQIANGNAASTLLKSGAKRKLDVSELEDPAPKNRSQATTTTAASASNGNSANDENDDNFVFQHKTALKPVSSSRKSNRFSRANQPQGTLIIPKAIPSPEKEDRTGSAGEQRKALAPKSTNSPSKRQVVGDSLSDFKQEKDKDKENDKPAPPFADRRRLQFKERSTDALGSRPPSRGKQSGSSNEPNHAAMSALSFNSLHTTSSNNHDDHDSSSAESKDLPPKTPSALSAAALFSPLLSSAPPSEPSSTRLPHQEAAIINSVEDVLNGSIGRGTSRRARAAVSYAEPNLRDKMRRPGKELVGAVEGLGGKKRDDGTGGGTAVEERRRESRSAAMSETPVPLPAPSSSLQEGDTGAKVRKEKDTEQAREQWKVLAPLISNTQIKEEPKSPLSERMEKESIVGIASETRQKQQNGTRNRENQLLNSSKATTDEDLEKSIQRLSIFDPPSSSPADQTSKLSASALVEQQIARDDPPAAPRAASTATKRKTPSSSSTSTTMASRRHSMQSSNSMPSLSLDNSNTNTNTNTNTHTSTNTTSSRHNRLPSSTIRPSSATSNRSGDDARSSRMSNSIASATSATSGSGGGVSGNGLRRTASVSVLKHERQQLPQQRQEQQQSNSQTLLSSSSPNDSVGTGGGGDGEAVPALERSRSERVATRRRSMMI